MQGKFDVWAKDYQGQNFFIAYSGGVDSRVLLDLTIKNKSLKLRGLIHICHHLRSAIELEIELKQIRSLSQSFGIPLFINHISPDELEQIGRQIGIEAAARHVRYRALFEIAGPNDLVFVAHHADDEVETQFINFIRGQDISTLRGIGSQSRLVRPLLNFTKKEIRDYARNKGLSCSEDSSNAKPEYLRNLLRNDIIPYIETKVPEIRKIRIAAALRTNHDEEYFGEMLGKIVCDFDHSQGISWVAASDFLSAPRPLRVRILFKLVSLANGGNPIEISRSILDDFIYLKNSDHGRQSQFGGFYFYFDSLSLKVGPAIVASQKNGYLMYLRREESYSIPGFGLVSICDRPKESKKSSFLRGAFGDICLRPLTSTLRTKLQSLVEARIRKDWLLLCSFGAWYAIAKDSRLDAVCILKADQQTTDQKGLWVIRDMES